MEEITQTLDILLYKLQNSKADIFNNTITTQTVKSYAILLKVLLTNTKNYTNKKILEFNNKNLRK